MPSSLEVSSSQEWLKAEMGDVSQKGSVAYLFSFNSGCLTIVNTGTTDNLNPNSLEEVSSAALQKKQAQIGYSTSFLGVQAVGCEKKCKSVCAGRRLLLEPTIMSHECFEQEC